MCSDKSCRHEIQIKTALMIYYISRNFILDRTLINSRKITFKTNPYDIHDVTQFPWNHIKVENHHE